MAETIPQAAAIPFRVKKDGGVEVLLIRWKEEDKWGVPKGLIDPGNTARETAEIESMEEAGISGELLDTELGQFTYTKFGGTCRVRVFALRVTTEHAEYLENGHRVRHWFPLETAVENVAREPLKAILRALPKALS